MSKAGLTIAHPSSDGCGSAIRVSVHYQTDERSGFLRIVLAGEKDGKFDFAGGIFCDLGFSSFSLLARSLAEGFDMPPQDVGGGAMLATKRDGKSVVVAAVRNRGGSDEAALKIVLTQDESYGLRLALEHASFFISFIKGVTP